MSTFAFLVYLTGILAGIAAIGSFWAYVRAADSKPNALLDFAAMVNDEFFSSVNIAGVSLLYLLAWPLSLPLSLAFFVPAYLVWKGNKK